MPRPDPSRGDEPRLNQARLNQERLNQEKRKQERRRGHVSQRDVVVVGASAGGVEALRVFVRGLPADLPAAVLIVLHMPRAAPSALTAILSRTTSLRVVNATDGEVLRRGTVYIAVPDRHLLIIGNRIRLSAGPAENGHRPAIDPLFRSAALAFGGRSVGVILSGARDDGATGLATIVARGGLAVVQDPADAAYASMPLAALATVTVDHTVPAAKIGPLLGEILSAGAAEAAPGDDADIAAGTADATLVAEVAAAAGADDSAEPLGEPGGYGCPSCGGSLFEVSGSPVPHYRCRVGHAWSAESLLEEQALALDGALWTALRALTEKSSLSRRMALGLAPGQSRERFEEAAADAEESSRLIQALIERLAPDEAAREPGNGENSAPEGAATGERV